MKHLKILGIFALVIMMTSATKYGRTEALSGLAGTGGTDKYVSAGTLITFNKPIWGVAITGSTTGVIDSLVTSDGGIAAGVYNYLDNGVTMRPGETFAFDEAITKLRITSGVEIMVNYVE